MGVDDGLNGQWLEAGLYDGERPADFAGPKALHIHLDQISTTENRLMGPPQTFYVLFQLLVIEQTLSCLCDLVTLTLCDSSIPR